MSRPSGPLVVAVDIGSSSVRAGIHDATARSRRGSFVQVPVHRDVDRAGGDAIPFDRLLEALTAVLDRLVERAEPDLPRIVAVGTSCFLHSIAALDRAGRPISSLLTWADTTSAESAAALRTRLDGGDVWQLTGAPLHASYWPAKILRLREVAGQDAQSFAGAPDLVWRSLTGEWGVDLSHASGTGLLDRAAGTWADSVLDDLDVPTGALPPIASRDASARLTGWAASRWPALADVSWFAPWSDAWCGNVGLGAGAGSRAAALQVGTSGAMRVVLDDPVPTVPAGLFAHRLPDGTSLVGGQLSEGGGVAAAVGQLLGRTPRSLEAEAAALRPDGHGLTALPFFAGERSPGYHAMARGVVSGLSLATTPAELYLSIIEAIGLRFADVDRRLSEHLGMQPAVLAAGGAIARSSLLQAVLASALGRPIERSSVGEASTRGAALLALEAIRAIPSAAAVAPPASATVEPDPAAVTALRGAAGRQDRLYSALLGSD